MELAYPITTVLNAFADLPTLENFVKLQLPLVKTTIAGHEELVYRGAVILGNSSPLYSRHHKFRFYEIFISVAKTSRNFGYLSENQSTDNYKIHPGKK